MKEIEERAELNLQYERDFCGYNLSDDMVRRAYVKGATEQKAIDIEKSKKAFCDTCMGRCEDKTHCDTLQRYINALEE